ncbi:MAG: hypothetical protein E4H14_15685 [Candidatus Thorarchaeota archaeon]|nr:MAG: hypothetical protein E4H14_15685 [Candidatus Thorarchaeota archaeon]
MLDNNKGRRKQHKVLNYNRQQHTAHHQSLSLTLIGFSEPENGPNEHDDHTRSPIDDNGKIPYLNEVVNNKESLPNLID